MFYLNSKEGKFTKNSSNTTVIIKNCPRHVIHRTVSGCVYGMLTIFCVLIRKHPLFTSNPESRVKGALYENRNF